MYIIFILTNIRVGINLSDNTQRHGRTKRVGGPQQAVQDRGLRHVQERQGHRADLRTEAEQGTVHTLFVSGISKLFLTRTD